MQAKETDLHEPPQDLIDMEEAIELLKTTRPTFYRWLRSGRIKGMKVGRQWRFYPEDIERFLKGQGPRVDLPLDIAPLNAQLISALGSEPEDLSALEGIEKTVRLILRLAQTTQASHLHLESLYQSEGETQGVLRLRHESGLTPVLTCDRRYLPALISQFKSLAGCDPLNQETPQEGQFSDLSGPENIRLRAHFLPALLGESLTLTLLKPDQQISLDMLKLRPSVDLALKNALKQGWGLIITSGPTGSGKTTTLYAALQEVASATVKSIALESPVERVFPWVVSVQTESESGESFVGPLKSLMQSDPDVILIGELRDTETVEMALRIGLTGHLVLTQLHCENAIQGLLRLVDLTGSAYTVTEAVKLVLNQRLLRRNCPACLHQVVLSKSQVKSFQPLFAKAGKSLKEGTQLQQGKGCPACQGTGYRGRLQITEALPMDPALSQLLHQGAEAGEIAEKLKQTGWSNWLEDGLERVLAGESSLEELSRVAGLL